MSKKMKRVAEPSLPSSPTEMRALLKWKEAAMAQRMDKYYRDKMAGVLVEEKKRAAAAMQTLRVQRDEALKVAEEAYQQSQAKVSGSFISC